MAKNKGKRAAGSGDEGDGRGKRAKNLYTTLSTRSNPRVLVNALVNLSPAQIDAIVDMGFGSLLSLSIVDFPSQLMYWLVANFNPASSELLLDSMRRIRIEPNDVREYWGSPRREPIVKKTKSETCDLYTGWPAMFGREDYKERNNKEIDLGGFGMGFIEPPFDGEAPIEPQLNLSGAWKEKDATGQGTSSSRADAKVVHLHVYLSFMLCAFWTWSRGAEFAMVGNVAKGILCSTALPGGVHRSDDGMEGTESQQNEAFWSKAENIAAIEAVESAFLKRDEFKKWCDEAPSFSIGLTQDTNVGRWEDILDTSRHYEKSVNEDGDVRDGGMASVEDVETEVGGVKPGGSGRSRAGNDIALERSKKVFPVELLGRQSKVRSCLRHL
ncbi:hypothetical protein DH2020_019985 [Rehmannia glutinosa]|uniref:Uncharacterized protein n=1 Tax=Rehmannia glutinosa TaxID=99300 RepID=A0ABR0WHR0_REHGL